MHKIFSFLFSIFIISLTLSCDEALTNANISPNSLDADQVDPAYVMTDVITRSATTLTFAGFAGNDSQAVLDALMQYAQQSQGGGVNVKNTFGWKGRGWDYRWFYLSSSNSNFLGKRAHASKDSTFLKGVSLTMQAFWFGYYTSGWGDIPFSEAYRAEERILKPAYDDQKDVFKGILSYLEEANEAFRRASPISDFTKAQDPMYKGDFTKWRSFANSLRLRFLMRLSEKTNEMKEIGVDVKAEFNKMVSDPNRYPIIVNNDANAVVPFPATSNFDAYPLGPLNKKANQSTYRRQKPGLPFVNLLKENRDPRLTVWIKPVEVQTVVEDKGSAQVIMKGDDGKVKRFIKEFNKNADTSLYVGMPIAAPNPDIHNGNSGSNLNAVIGLDPSVYSSTGANPFVSYFASMFLEDNNPLLPGIFLVASEVNLILAEAAARGWISGSAEEYFKKGIQTSISQYNINDGDPVVYNPDNHKIEVYNENEFLNKMISNFHEASDKLLPIMEQKWLSLFLQIEAWFDWRRTGYPDLGKNIVNGPRGEIMPIRFYFGDSEKNFNGENVNKAISNLDPPVDDQWSKMWLLQGTGKPY